MNREFVERRDGSFYFAGSRVPLAHLVREFQHRELPEATLTWNRYTAPSRSIWVPKKKWEADITERERAEDEFAEKQTGRSSL